MKKRMSREEKRQQAVIDIINQMFVIAGHNITYDDIKDRKGRMVDGIFVKEADE